MIPRTMISFSSATIIGAIIAAENVGAFTPARLKSFVHDFTSSRPPSFRHFKDKEYEGVDTLVADVLIDTAAVDSNRLDTIDSIDLIPASRCPSTIATVPEDSSPKIPQPKLTEVTPTQSYRPLTFEEDIEPYLDIARPYYALLNEHVRVDEKTGEQVFVCTANIQMPKLASEFGDIGMGEAARLQASAGEVAALLLNPKKSRFHYLASRYEWTSSPNKGMIDGEELSNISFMKAKGDNEVILTAKCVDINRRYAVCDILLETKESTWFATLEYSIVCANIFAKLNSAQIATLMPTLVTKDASQPYTSFGELQNIKTYSDSSFCEEWVTMSATLPPSDPSDFLGHFYDNKAAVPHSVMLLHNRDLIGEAIAKFCGFGLSLNGIRMLSWKCSTENLHWPKTHGLKFETRVYLSRGGKGRPGSIYVTESIVRLDEIGDICYKAVGHFIIEPETSPSMWPLL